MTNTEQTLFVLAIGAAAFIFGVHYGLKKASDALAAKQASDQLQGDPSLDWFTTFGKL